MGKLRCARASPFTRCIGRYTYSRGPIGCGSAPSTLNPQNMQRGCTHQKLKTVLSLCAES